MDSPDSRETHPSPRKVSRRKFLHSALTAGVGILAAPLLPNSSVHAAPTESDSRTKREIEIAYLSQLQFRASKPMSEIPPVLASTADYFPSYSAIPGYPKLIEQLPDRFAILQLCALTGIVTREELEYYQQGQTTTHPNLEPLSNPRWKDRGTTMDDGSFFPKSYNCNLYTQFIAGALLPSGQIGHWEAADGSPNFSGIGTEISAANMSEWFNRHGAEYGWLDTTYLPLANRINMLKAGYLFFIAQPFDTSLVYGLPGPENTTIPVLTRASHNTLAAHALETGFFYEPWNPATRLSDYYTNFRGNYRYGLMFAHKIRGAVIDSQTESELLAPEQQTVTAELRSHYPELNSLAGNDYTGWLKLIVASVNLANDTPWYYGPNLSRVIEYSLQSAGLAKSSLDGLQPALKNLADMSETPAPTPLVPTAKLGLTCVNGLKLAQKVLEAVNPELAPAYIGGYPVDQADRLTRDLKTGEFLTLPSYEGQSVRLPVTSFRQLEPGDIVAISKNSRMPYGHVTLVTGLNPNFSTIGILDFNAENDNRGRLCDLGPLHPAPTGFSTGPGLEILVPGLPASEIPSLRFVAIRKLRP